MADPSVWERMTKRPLESYNKTWLGFIAVVVVAVVIGVMLLVHALGAGYRHYTAEFLQAASLRVGNPIVVAGIPVGNVTSMKLVGDHVEAGLKVRDNIALGKDSRAHDQGHHHPGFALPRIGAQRPGAAAQQHLRLGAHRGPLRSAIRIAGRHHDFRAGRFRPVRPVACGARQAARGPARGGAAGDEEYPLAVVHHRGASRPTGTAAAQHRTGDQHVATPASRHRQSDQPGTRPAGPIRRAASRFPRDDAIPDQVLSTP